MCDEAPAFQHKMEAIKAVLLETCQVLSTAQVQFVVAGGWVPYLREGNQSLRHPGTNDVDILFNDDRKPIRGAVEALLGAGYLPSAKHPFQLLKELPVAHERFVFNVDLMHPIEGGAEPDMFQDIIDLGIRADYDSLETHVVKSICFPSSRIVFDEKLWSLVTVSGTSAAGGATSVGVPLVDEAGLILSKCASVSKEKRDRDSFDIYFLLSGARGATIASRLLSLADRFPQVEDQLSKLRAYLQKTPAEFDARVSRFASQIISASPALLVTKLLSGS